jgi:hypothetical protein
MTLLSAKLAFQAGFVENTSLAETFVFLPVFVVKKSVNLCKSVSKKISVVSVPARRDSVAKQKSV